jgi:hypothetical protein
MSDRPSDQKVQTPADASAALYDDSCKPGKLRTAWSYIENIVTSVPDIDHARLELEGRELECLRAKYPKK